MKKNITFLLAIFLITTLTASGQTAIRISENGRYFVNWDGKPFFWLGDTQWELFHVFSVPEAKAILKKRKEQGFTVIQVMTTGVFPEAAAIVKMKPLRGLQAWLNYNPLTPNERYFERMDSIVAAAQQLNMVLAVGVYHAWDQDKGRITVKNAEPWAKWLASRYKTSKNIVWSMYPHAKQASDSVVMAIVKGIQEGDQGRHLITMHPDPGSTSSSIMHTQPWLSFNTIQTWTSNFTNFKMVAADYSLKPAKPVINGEARYEGEDKTTPFETRRVAYWTGLAGGFYSYGHAGNWLTPLSWKEWLDSPGARQMKVVREVFESVDWWNLIPDQSVFTGGAEGNAAAHSINGDWMIVYITTKDPVSLNFNQIKAPSVTGVRIDPRTGAKTEISRFDTKTIHTFSLPKDREDEILIFKK